MPVKKTKLHFERKGKFGNLLFSYRVYAMWGNKTLNIGEIRVFKRGEYCLPEGMFPRGENSMLVKTKSIQLAKKKCQNWFDDLIKYFSTH